MSILSLSNVRSEGGLLPVDVLQRIVSRDRELPGMYPKLTQGDPSDSLEREKNPWNLSGGERLTDAINRSPCAQCGHNIRQSGKILPHFPFLAALSHPHCGLRCGYGQENTGHCRGCPKQPAFAGAGVFEPFRCAPVGLCFQRACPAHPAGQRQPEQAGLCGI